MLGAALFFVLGAWCLFGIVKLMGAMLRPKRKTFGRREMSWVEANRRLRFQLKCQRLRLECIKPRKEP